MASEIKANERTGGAGSPPASSREPERRNQKVGDEVHRRQVPALLEQEVQPEAGVHPLHEVRRQSWRQLDLRALQAHGYVCSEAPYDDYDLR
jgi:hypothetical protein